MKKIRIFALMSMLLALFLAENACTQNKQEAPKATEDLAMAQQKPKDFVTAPKTKIYIVKTVTAGEANKAANFTFAVDGKETNFKEFVNGKYVLLNFWATWCPPCRAEIPDLIEISKEMQDDLVVVGVALEKTANASDAIKKVDEFAEKSGIPYANFVADGDARAALAEAYGGIAFIPQTFLIDKEGNIVNKIEGGQSKAQFVQQLKAMMKKK